MTTTTDARLTTADQRSARLAAVLDDAVTAAAVAAVTRATERTVGAHVAAVEVECLALADTLAELSRLAAPTPADASRFAASHVRDAARDAMERHAADACLSLDASTTDDPEGITLADVAAASALLSNSADDASGGYRGVARVIHPTDILRPLTMPTSAEVLEAALDALTEEGRRLVRATVAVNVAAVEQARATADEITAVAAAVAADRDRAAQEPHRAARLAAVRATLKAAQATAKEARRAAREVKPLPRTSAVAEVIGTSGRGRAGTALAEQQRSTARAALAQADAVRQFALDVDAERLDALADAARRQYRRSGGTDGLPHVATMTTYQAIHSARRAHAARVIAAQAVQTTHEQPTGAARGATDACPTEGASPRPRRALHGYDAGHALPGSAKSLRADVKAGACPTKSRTADDAPAAWTHRPTARLVAAAPLSYRLAGTCPRLPQGAPVAAPTLPADWAARTVATARALHALTGGARGYQAPARHLPTLSPADVARALGAVA